MEKLLPTKLPPNFSTTRAIHVSYFYSSMDAKLTNLCLFATVGNARTTVWCTGYYFKVVGDKQLKTFISNPINKGQLM